MTPRFSTIVGRSIAAGAMACCVLASSPGQAAERLYCFSDICLGDLPAALETIPLKDLSRGAARRPQASDLKAAVLKAAALPGIGEDDRSVLAKHVAADGRFVIDAQTLRIFLGVTTVCVPMAPFAATFTSANGHATTVEFDVFRAGETVQFGVKAVGRTYNIQPGTAAYADLVGDLSRKFDFRIDNPGPVQLPGGEVATFVNGAQGFELAFAIPDMPDRESAIATQRGCGSADRAPIE